MVSGNGSARKMGTGSNFAAFAKLRACTLFAQEMMQLDDQVVCLVRAWWRALQTLQKNACWTTPCGHGSESIRRFPGL
jgi:hypothetical protein